MKRMLFFLFLCVIVKGATVGQSLEGRTALNRPETFIAPTVQQAEQMTHDGNRREGTPWIVYSERQNNSTFKNIGDQVPFKTLDFLDGFYVLEEQGNFLRLVKDPDLSIVVGFGHRFSKHAEDYGWINKQHMLLWGTSIVEEKGRVPIKAMTQNTLEYIEGVDLRFQDFIDVDYFSNPELTRPTGRQLRLYEILYVFKMTDTAVLLGAESNIPPLIDDVERRRTIIYGWVPKSRLVLWDNRVVLEPNWESSAVQERKRQGVMADVFLDSESAIEFARGEPVRSNPIIREAGMGEGLYYDARQIGEWQRYPLLRANNDILNVGVMGEVNTRSEEIENLYLDRVTVAQVDRRATEHTRQIANINIVFVMDGTDSMKDYFHPASEALINSMREISASSETSNSVFRFGAVVYRDEPARAFNRLAEIQPLTENYQSVANWLRQIDVRDFGNDPWREEAVYYGIKTALIAVAGPPDETNVLVLVGDAGNHTRDDRSQVDENQIIQLLVDNNTHVLALQVVTGEHSSYGDFRNQVKRILKAQAESMQEGRPRWQELSSNRFRLDGGPRVATLVSPPQGQLQIHPSVLTNEIIDGIKFAQDYTTDITRTISDIVQGGRSIDEAIQYRESSRRSSSKYVGSFEAALTFELSRMDIPREVLLAMAEKRGQIYIPGYTSMTRDGLEHPLYKRSLLLSIGELAGIVRDFDELQRVRQAADMRTALVNTWTEILIRHLGESDRESIASRSMEDLMRTVVGIPSTNTLINSLRLEDITNIGKISNAEINRYIEDINLMNRDLSRILNQVNPPYNYSFSSGNVRYFWISEDLIP